MKKYGKKVLTDRYYLQIAGTAFAVLIVSLLIIKISQVQDSRVNLDASNPTEFAAELNGLVSSDYYSGEYLIENYPLFHPGISAFQQMIPADQTNVKLEVTSNTQNEEYSLRFEMAGVANRSSDGAFTISGQFIGNGQLTQTEPIDTTVGSFVLSGNYLYIRVDESLAESLLIDTIKGTWIRIDLSEPSYRLFFLGKLLAINLNTHIELSSEEAYTFVTDVAELQSSTPGQNCLAGKLALTNSPSFTYCSGSYGTFPLSIGYTNSITNGVESFNIKLSHATNTDKQNYLLDIPTEYTNWVQEL